MARSALAQTELKLADLSGPERSAALMMFVHPRVAAGLLSRLSAGEVTQIGIAMKRLERLSPQLIEDVVSEFVRDLSDLVHLPHSGRDFALQKLSSLVQEDKKEAVQAEMDREVGQEFEAFISTCLPSTSTVKARTRWPWEMSSPRTILSIAVGAATARTPTVPLNGRDSAAAPP